MRCLPGRRAPWMITLAALAAGCGGTGTETASPGTGLAPSPAIAQAPAGPKASDAQPAPGGVAPEVAEDQAKLTTPNTEVDTSKTVDVVTEEVKGGEATADQPTPPELLYAEANLDAIQDEPFAVKVPLGLSPLIANVHIPPSNPMTKAKVELGKQLYFDPRVSKDGTVSCATCHNPEKGWTDNLATSVGIDGQVGGRNAPTVLNTVYGKTMFWDGRAPSLEGQAQGPIQNKIEMGDQSYGEIIQRLRQISGYREQFQKVFGTDVTLDGMAKAIAAFERTALSGNSPYDRYVLANKDDNPEDLNALSESAKRGMVLFGLRLNDEDDFKTDVVLKKANCTACHAGANFTNEQFHNLGVGYDPEKKEFADLGRFVISPVGAKDPTEIGAFKTPTVRDIARTFPYFHDGSAATLEAVVEHYDIGGIPNPYLDKDMKPLKLTEQEKKDLVEFMKALTGEEIKVALPTLPVGPDGTTPDPRSALGLPEPRKAAATDPHGPIRR